MMNRYTSLLFFSFIVSFFSYTQSGWTLSFGGNASDYGYTNCTDNSGNVFSGGSINGSVDFSPHQPGFDVTTNVESPYLMKIDSLRNVLWLRVWESTAQSKIVASCMDDSGHLYVIGSFLGQIDLDPTSGTQLTSSNVKGLFISQFDLSGNQVWVKSLEVSGNVLQPTTIDVSSNGHLKITGNFDGLVDFDPNGGIQTLASNGMGNDLFILDLTDNGDFQWVEKISGLYSSAVTRGATIADDGSLLITGDFSSTTDFDPGPDSTIVVPASGGSLFLLRLDQQGDLVWFRYFDHAAGRDVAFDHSGNVILTGIFVGTMDFDFGVNNHYVTSEQYDTFTLKMSNDSIFQWVNTISGTAGQFSQCLTIAENNSIHLVGAFEQEIDIDYNGFDWQSNPLTYDDSYFVSMDSLGDFIQASEIVGAGSTLVQSVACNSLNQIYLVGYYEGDADLDMNPMMYDYHTTNGLNDVFQIKVGPIDFTGIEELYQEQLSIYPNPVQLELNVSVSGNYLVYDAIGKLQLSGFTTGQIDISELIPGIYILELRGKGTNRFFKY